MLKGLFTSAGGMVQNIFEQQQSSNNLANVNTAGFKKDFAYLQEKINAELQKDQLRTSEDGMLIAKDKVYTNFQQGKIVPTNNTLDVAINGNGFFVVNSDEGERYSRNGQLKLNNNGLLVTNTGDPVQGEGGNITIDGSEIFINDKGAIYVDGDIVDTLRLTDFADKKELKKVGASLYKATDKAQVIPASDYAIKQGAYEGSNVNIIKEMVNMIDVQRTYEANSKVLTTLDESLRKIVNEVGKY